MKIFVQAKAGSKNEEIRQTDLTHFVIRVKEPAREGKANQEVARLLAKHFQIPRSNVKMIRGTKSKSKIFEIASD